MQQLSYINFLILLQMQNKNQAKSIPPTHHFQICIHNRRPFLQASIPIQVDLLQQVKQNGMKKGQPEGKASPDVFTIAPQPAQENKLLISLNPCLHLQKERSSLNWHHKNLLLPADKQSESFEEAEESERSLIEELLSLESAPRPSLQIAHKKLRLQQLNIIETQSISEDQNSSLFDTHSDIIGLTEEEQHFFTNFIITELEESLEDEAKLTTKIMIESSTNNHNFHPVLEERKKVIRNFFKPKASFFKDDKTRCNSSTNLDEINDSSNRNSLSPMWAQRQNSSKGKRQNKLLSPLIME